MLALRLARVPIGAIRAFEPFLAFTPLLSVAILRARGIGAPDGKRPGPIRLHMRGTSWRRYLFALMLFPALGAAALAFRWAGEGRLPVFASRPWSSWLIDSLTLFVLPGVAEEPGWRGWLQHELRARRSVFTSSVLVGLVWGVWHARDRVLHPGRFEQAGLAWFFVLIVAASVVIGWIFDWTSESLLAAMTAHFGANAVFHFLPIFVGDERGTARIYTALVCGAALVLGAIGGVGRRSPPEARSTAENRPGGDSSEKSAELSPILSHPGQEPP